MTNYLNTVVYTGITNNLERRVLEHKEGTGSRFTRKYKCAKLVWYEETDDVAEAIAGEKRIKAGSRQKKIDLVNAINPEWKDLAEEWFH